jgi:sigma-E factor negative regulatory protein RseB
MVGVATAFRRPWLACAFAAASLFPAHSLLAQTAQSGDNSKADIQWLAKIQRAATRLNYAGTFVYQQGSSVQSSRISHFVDATGEHEKLEVLDGKPQEIIRKNDEVHCYIPGSKTLLIERRVERDHFPGLLNASAADVAENYTIRRGEPERIAGIDCETISLTPKDAYRYGYRLWTDQQSGLLLKAQTLNEKGDVIEQIAFTSVKINLPFDRSLVKPSFTAKADWKVEHSDSARSNVSLAQWEFGAVPAGFRRVSEFTRTIGGRQEVAQIVFSDGLAAISVFIESRSAIAGEREGASSQGAVSMTTRRLGDHWVTVVGEAPMLAVKQVANSLQLRK